MNEDRKIEIENAAWRIKMTYEEALKLLNDMEADNEQ